MEKSVIHVIKKGKAMDNTNTINLDAKINEASFKLAENLIGNKGKNEIEKALGVLANDGVYAFYVFCEYKKIYIAINESLEQIEKYLPKGINFSREALEDSHLKLENLLYLKDILEKTLIYTRYHLKAMGEDNDR